MCNVAYCSLLKNNAVARVTIIQNQSNSHRKINAKKITRFVLK
jgi:hypothetical protein